MNTIQVAVASRGSARIFECVEGGSRLRLLAEIDNPGLGIHERDLKAPRAGRVYNRGGGRPQAFADRTSPRDEAAQRFARALARRVGGRMREHDHDALILVAEPRMLGYVRGGLSKTASARLAGVVPKDLAHETRTELERRLGPAIRDARAAGAKGTAR
jgi:protein required for attachment to host cells